MTAILFSLLLLQAPSAGHNWADVVSLPSTVTVQVELGAGRVTGTFVSATSDTIVVRIGGRHVAINRSSVNGVGRATGKSKRSRNAGIGMFVGMGVGLIIYGTTCGNNCMSEGAPVWTAPLSIIGAIAGVAAPPLSWHSVYRK